MPCPHFSIGIIKRSSNQSAVAGAAYQSDSIFFCEYDMKRKNYSSKKGGVFLRDMERMDILENVNGDNMPETIIADNRTIKNIGGFTYQIGVHFDESGKEGLKENLIRIICKENH